MSSLILETCTRALFHTVLLFSLFLLFAGHNAPGGGFVGGLVAAAALVLRSVAYGSDDVQRIVRARPESLLGAGLLLSAAVAAAPLALGGDLLESGIIDLALPAVGAVKLSSTLAFDIGVYLVVVGFVLTVLRALGGESQR